MSMRDFLDGDCGQNPVLKVANHFTRDNTGLGSSNSRQVLDINRQDVTLLPPTTFQMDSLLREIQSMGSYTNGPIQAQAISELAAHPEWAEEFLKHEQFVQEPEMGPQDWIRDYMSKELELDSVWDRDQYRNPVGGPLQQVGQVQSHFNSFHHPSPLHGNIPYQIMEQPNARDLLDDSKWVTELTQNSDLSTTAQTPIEKTELMATAEEFLKSVSDPKIQASDFMNYVEKLSTGEIGSDGKSSEQRSSQWASEYDHQRNQDVLGGRSSEDVLWSNEFVTGTGEDRGAVGGASREDFWQKLNDEWEKMAQDDSPNHPWLSESATKLNKPYQFAEENPYIQDTENPLEEGKKKLLVGDIPSAALFFEAAVHKDGQNPECWLLLGTTQALNEQDPLSIAALNKCIELQPNNLTALMSIAASLTNESFHLQACNALKNWLKFNPKYSSQSLVSEKLGDTVLKSSSLLHPDELLKVQRLFIQAARLNPSAAGVDPDVQCGLGILFNLGSEYEKAADCFQAALGVNPDNPLLWNRLGATLANGGKSSEAIGAYRRALEICPGFVRTRYNLGIACVNLGAYQEAAEHFISSLRIQSSGKTFNASQPVKMSDSIWASLRTSLHLLDKAHLTKYVDQRDLNGISHEFNLES